MTSKVIERAPVGQYSFVLIHTSQSNESSSSVIDGHGSRPLRIYPESRNRKWLGPFPGILRRHRQDELGRTVQRGFHVPADIVWYLGSVATSIHDRRHFSRATSVRRRNGLSCPLPFSSYRGIQGRPPSTPTGAFQNAISPPRASLNVGPVCLLRLCSPPLCERALQRRGDTMASWKPDIGALPNQPMERTPPRCALQRRS